MTPHSKLSPSKSAVPSYQKLVRDLIPERIRARGELPITRVLDSAEYRSELERKLQEEVSEVLEAQNAEELADVLEVLMALAETYETSWSVVESARAEKARSHGRFSTRTYLEGVEEA